jgi:hypothetical protein
LGVPLEEELNLRPPFRSIRAVVALAATIGLLFTLMPSAISAADPDDVVVAGLEKNLADDEADAPPSGTVDFRDVDIGNALTECPQAGAPIDKQPMPLDLRDKDKVEQLSNGGDDNKTNQDFACFPQDETSIAINPTNQKNAIAGANDYRLGWGTSGFYVTTDGGNHWYDGIKPFPTNANQARDHIDGGGDPAVVFDRGGTAYYNDLHFARENDESGVFVSRSTNGGFTWSRPCVPAGSTDTAARCGGNGDVRRPGDGVVAYTPDNDNTLNSSVPTHDKNYIAAGPRPAGVTAVCFAPISKTPIPAGSAGCPQSLIGPDRLYVTWTIFGAAGQGHSTINVSYSDDRGYSWSPPRVISGSAPFCVGGFSPTGCDDNQGSVPTVNPSTGFLYVVFENFNTPDENQYLMVRSRDGGQTFEGPFFISVVFDVNYPTSGQNRQDCTQRGQGTRRVLTNSCFRIVSYGNMVVDRRGGEFADDLYAVFSDNRNGSRQSSNSDVFLFVSKDGGTTWIGPTRVNDDPSRPPNLATEGGRDCGRIVGRVCPPTAPNFGNDQWFPWIDISDKGDLNVVFYDRRLDTNSTAGEWPDSRAAPNGRPGNYLVWNFGAQCSVTTTATVTVGTTTIPAGARQCLGNEAAIVTPPTSSPNPASGAVIPGGAQTVFPFRNFNVSDTASNWDYTFRAGIFAGDYNNVAVDHQLQAWALWTDARNGRSARQQPGRNPICEQSDVFDDEYSAQSAGSVRTSATQGMDLYLVTPCALAMQEPGTQP